MEPKTRVPGERLREVRTADPRDTMLPAKSSSGMEGECRKSGGMRVMRIEGPGFRAQWVMRMWAEVGDGREGTR